MAGRCALNAEIVVRVHGREPELWSIGRMADRLSAGTGSIPVSSAISLREIRPAARTLASKSRYEGSSPSSPAKSEHGIAAGASGLQPDDASSTLAARSKDISDAGPFGKFGRRRIGDFPMEARCCYSPRKVPFDT